MNHKTEEATIDVEVLEVDGVPVEAGKTESGMPDSRQSWRDWTAWQGRVRRLDPRWWPLWVLLGIFIFTVLVTVGLAVAVLFIAWRIFIGVIRTLLRCFNPDRAVSRR